MTFDFEALNFALLIKARTLLPEWLPGGELSQSEYLCQNLTGKRGKNLSVSLSTGEWADFTSETRGGDLISLFAAIHKININDAYYALRDQYEIKPEPKPKPPSNALLNIEKLTSEPSKPVLIVDSKQALDSAELFAGSRYIVTTWRSYKECDFSPLKSRRVLIWPSAETSKRTLASRLAARLLDLCKEVKVIDTNDFNGGMNAASFDFKDFDSFAGWAKPRAKLISKPKPSRAEVVPDLPPMPTSAPAIPAPSQPPPPATRSEIALWESLGLTMSHNSGRPHNNLNNITKALLKYRKLSGNIWFDEFHQKVFSCWEDKETRAWEDHDYISLQVFLQQNLSMPNINKITVQDAVTFVAKKNTKNEPRDWIKSLVWDQTPRVSNLFSHYFGAEASEYTSVVSKNFMVSMIARLFRPGCKVDTMVILEGNQGAFKSSALKALAGKFFTENNNDMNKNDFFQSLSGFFLIELSELDSFNKTEATRIKTVLSTASDNYRAPYARHPAIHPRMSIFVGTTNELNYLKDSTGGRRFWPISCGKINLDLIEQDREQLFAEAHALFKQGENWWLVPESAKEEQEARRVQDPWEEIIAKYLSSYPTEFITTVDLAMSTLKMDEDRINQGVSIRIGKVMRSLGWAPGKRRVGAGKILTSGWLSPESGSFQVISKSQDATIARW